MSIAFLTSLTSAEEYKRVTPGYSFKFPRDHGSHPAYPLEWWYFTGHLRSKEKRSFGFQITFFRIGVTPAQSQSAWHTSSLYLMHFAVTDDKNNLFYHDSRLARPAFALAGSSEEELNVWLDKSFAKMQKNALQLNAEGLDKDLGKKFSIVLELSSNKPVVLHGEQGYSRKGHEEDQASYYMSLTDLKGVAKLTLGNEEFELAASAWMDHEVMNFNAESDQIGWDWMAIKLDSGEEIMFFTLRSGTAKEKYFSSGTFIDQAGNSEQLDPKHVKVRPINSWTSPKSGKTYPSGWRMEIPDRKLELGIMPTVKEQELREESNMSRTYWEGRCQVEGTRNDKLISGNAYVELVGY